MPAGVPVHFAELTMRDVTQFIYEFGPFQLRPDEHLFLRDGLPLALSDRAFAVLIILVERAGHLVEKTDLMSAVWKDCHVEEGNLAVSISTLRKALGDPRNEQSYIKTVSRHGHTTNGNRVNPAFGTPTAMGPFHYSVRAGSSQ